MHIPSIQTLRALDAAARLGSYTGAADALGVTHGAISHRIRALEAAVGHSLFVRAGNGMEPTAQALRLLVPVRQALDLLASAFPGPSVLPQMVRISVLPSMASRWLVPRLGRFRSAHPEIDLRIDARLEFAPLGGGGVDCSIRYGSGDWQGVHVSHLGDEILFPVCAPDYRDRLRLAKPGDLRRAVLLRHDHQLWRPWLETAGLDWPEPRGGTLFADTNLMLDAAVAGEGVVLARRRIVAGEIASGRLVRLFEAQVRDRQSYYFVRPYRIEPARLNAVAALEHWAREQFLADS